jgi:hypothetical protein
MRLQVERQQAILRRHAQADLMRYVFRGVAVTLAAGLVLSGCGMFGGKETKLVCPATFIAPDADKMAVFKPGGSTLSDVSYGVRITNLQSKCDRADKGIRVDTQISFRLVSNDKSLRAGAFEYFVSVVDGYHNILTKQTYGMPFEFDARMHDMDKKDELYENLPLRDVGSGSNYAIVIGLQLTEAQLQFNRAASHSPAVSIPPTVSVAVPAQPTNSASTP